MKQISIPENINNLSSLLEDGLLFCDQSGKILFSNNLANQYLGKKVVGQFLYDVIKIDEFKNLVESQDKGIFDDQISYQTDDLFRRLLMIKVKKIEDNLYGILFLDMTLQRNLEKVRRDFVANVSHELRSPLTSLVGFIETLLKGNVEDEETRIRFLNIMTLGSNYFPWRAKMAGYDEQASPFDPIININVSAWLLYEHTAGGWQHWVCQ